MLVALVSFTLASVLIVLLPGPDSLVVVRGLVRGGRRGGAADGRRRPVRPRRLGRGRLAGALGAPPRRARSGYDALKVAGACYLIWIGVRSLLSVRRSADEVAAAEVEGDGPMAPARPRLGGSGFVAGFLTDILNPKVGVFFVSFLPGFVPHGDHAVGWTTLGFGALFTFLTALYFLGLIALSGTVAAWMASPRIRRRLDAMTGLVLVGFGVRLATET